MIFDIRSLLSDKQAVTVDAASTNVYDLGVPGIAMPGSIQLNRKLGKGIKVPFLVQVNVDFTTGDGATDLEIIIQSDDNSAFSSAANVVSVTVPLASLKAGYQLPFEYLPTLSERYFRLYYNCIGGTFTAGKVTAGVVAAVDGSYQG